MFLLNRNSKKLLNLIRASEPDYDSDNKVFSFTFIRNRFGESGMTTLRHLEKNGYIEYISYSDGQKFGFSLTELGNRPSEFTIAKVKSVLLFNLFIPIVVSIITTLITLYIKGLLL